MKRFKYPSLRGRTETGTVVRTILFSWVPSIILVFVLSIPIYWWLVVPFSNWLHNDESLRAFIALGLSVYSINRLFAYVIWVKKIRSENKKIN
tara:strand:+ start:236 stop:514 length:279 start_codon:yes stop_codon:yes gene_type:complete